MNRLRLLFISNFFPPYELGGYEQWCAEIADLLKRRGHDVRVLTSIYGVNPGVKQDPVHISRKLHLQTDVSYYKPIDFLLFHAAQEKSNALNLRREIDQFSPDLIMIWGMWNMSHTIAYWAEKWAPDRVVYYISNYWPMDADAHITYWMLPVNHIILRPIKNLLKSFVQKKLSRENYPPHLEFKHAVCCSQYVRDILVENGKLPSHAGVLYGGTDPGPFIHQPRTEKKFKELRLLYFGRLIHDKGVHTAIKAIGLLKQKGLADHLRMTILGSGHPDYEENLYQLAANFGVQNHVKFVKHIPRNEIPKWLGEFDVFLFTSIWPEPMARSVMEAMASGLLVIGTEVGGQAEMLFNGVNSLTFQPDNAEMLSDQIIHAQDNWPAMIELARAGQKMVLEKFTLKRMVDDLEKYLYEISRSIKATQ